MANPFKQILSSGLDFFSSPQKPSEVVGIDIGSSSIKTVQTKEENGVAILETYGEVALGPLNDSEVGDTANLSVEKTAEAISHLFKEANITTKVAQFSIQSAASMVFILNLPKTSKKDEMDSIVSTEARKHIPVPMSEVSLDYWPLPAENQDKEMEVLVAAIHNDTLEKYKDIAEQVKLKDYGFEIEIFSAMRSSTHRQTKPILLIDFGASKTKVVILDHGVIRHFHIINQGSTDITQKISQALNISFKKAEQQKQLYSILEENEEGKELIGIMKDSADRIINEVNNLVLDFQKKNNKTLDKIILAGGGSKMKGFDKSLSKELATEVVFSDSFSRLNHPEFLKDILQESSPEFSVSVGSTLGRLL